MRRLFALSLLATLMLAVAAPPAAARQTSVARGIIFYSPTCGHCHRVITEDLPVIFEDHGGAPDAYWDPDDPDPAFVLLTNGTLELLMVNVTLEAGAGLYTDATIAYRVPEEMQGVPRLVMGDEFYVGDVDIPAALPVLIAEAADAGGIDWPDLPGMADALATIPATETTTTTATTTTSTTEAGAPPTSEPAATTTSATTTTTTTTTGPFPLGTSTGSTSGLANPPTTPWDKFAVDPVGNSLAVVVLLGMLASLALVWVLVRRGLLTGSPGWLIPLLALAGMAVAVYLSYVESSGSEAVCGPVGDCNAVQQSKFALLFGVIHVGLIGLVSYAVVLVTWLAARLANRPLADWAAAALAAGAAGGVAFSIYLTFLEPFVIGATCIWCLSSAVIVTILLWLAAGPGWAAWRRLRGDAG
jgi:uncharacterized membrane protein